MKKANKQETANPVLVVAFALLYILGGLCSIYDDYMLAAISFSIGAVISAGTVTWSKLFNWQRFTIIIGTLLGVGMLFASIVF